MALIVDQQQSQDRHYCRICKKGFGCGRALGGHMRTHGISDNIANIDDYNASKGMYALRTNPNRLKTCRVCDNCGIEFFSWKSFLDHGKCTLEDADSDAGELFLGSDNEEGRLRGGYEHNSSKGKRSYKATVGNTINLNCPSSEEEDLAHCLMMLSNGIVEPEESFASASKDEAIRHHLNHYNQSAKLVIPRGLFECKSCKKVFNSHQALGGHRASHKKVKGCFAAKLDQTNDNEADQAQVVLGNAKFQYYHNGSSVKKKAKVHECSICYRVFPSGQALGGHKRCHWITSNNSPDHTSGSVVKFDQNQFYDQANVKVNNLPKDSETLDLNLHALDAKQQNNQISQEIFLLPWVGGDNCEKDKIYRRKQNITDDKTEPKTKSVKLIELKKMNACETSSQWLQVGIGSSSSQAGSDL